MKEPKPLILVEHRSPRGTMELKLMGYIRHTVRNPEPFETASWYGISDMRHIIQSQIDTLLSSDPRYKQSSTIQVHMNETYTSLQVVKLGTVTGKKEILITISKPSKMKDIETKRIPLGDLIPASFNNRQHYSDTELKDLTASVKEHGIQANLVVRPHPEKSGKYEIVGGFRRHKAGTAAGILDAPCNVKEMTDDEAYQLMLIDNLHREDIHPLDEGNSFKKLSEKHTAEEIAGMIHKSKSYVLKRMKLADLTPAFQRLFYENKMTYVQAIQIARITPADQERVLKNCMRTRYMEGGRTETYLQTEQEIRIYIQDNVALDLKNAPFDMADIALVVKAGSCDVCPKRTRNQGDLFDNATKQDRCMDPACFSMKKAAHIALQVNKLEQKFDKVLTGEKAAYNNTIKIGDKNVPIVKKSEVAGAIPVVVKSFQYGNGNDKGLGQTVYVAPDFKNPPKSPAELKRTNKDKRDMELRKAVQAKCRAFRELLFFKIFDKLVKVMPSGKYMEATLPDWAFTQFYDAMVDYGGIGNDDLAGIIAYGFKLPGMGPETEVKDWNTQFDDIKGGTDKLKAAMRKIPVANLLLISLTACEASDSSQDVTKTSGIYLVATHLKLDPDGLKKAFSKSYDTDLRVKELKAEGEKNMKGKAVKGQGLAALLSDAKKVNGAKVKIPVKAVPVSKKKTTSVGAAQKK